MSRTCSITTLYYGTCPAYLTNIVKSVGVGRTRSRLRSTSSTDFTLLLRTKLGERAFSDAGPAAWNTLSEGLRAVPDVAELRKQPRTRFTPLLLTCNDCRLLIYVLDYWNVPILIM